MPKSQQLIFRDPERYPGMGSPGVSQAHQRYRITMAKVGLRGARQLNAACGREWDPASTLKAWVNYINRTAHTYVYTTFLLHRTHKKEI